MRGVFVRHRQEHAGSAATHPRLPPLRQPCQHLVNDRAKPDRDGLQIVAGGRGAGKGRYCQSWRVPCQFRRLENSARCDRHTGPNDDIPPLWQIHRRQRLAHAFGKGAATGDEHRNVGAEAQPQSGQALERPVQPPQPVQAEQDGRRVGTSAAQSGARRNALYDPDVRPGSAAGRLAQQSRGADRQIVFVGQFGQPALTDDPTVVPSAQVDAVTPVQQLEYRLQQVVAVVTATVDMQPEVQLGRRSQPQRVRRRLIHGRPPSPGYSVARCRAAVGHGCAPAAHRPHARPYRPPASHPG